MEFEYKSNVIVVFVKISHHFNLLFMFVVFTSDKKSLLFIFHVNIHEK